MKKAQILSVLLMLTSTHALSTDIEEITTNDTHVIYMNGPIQSGDSDKFISVVENTIEKKL